MDNNKKRIIIEMSSLFQRSLRRKRICMYPNCTCEAINSHLLQKHGIVDHIAENAHVYELNKYDFIRNNINGIGFHKIGINDAISYHLFCNTHDSLVFKSIEDSFVDFDNYRNQLLFAYRAICTDIRKKEIDIDFCQFVLQSNSVSDKERNQMASKIKGCRMNINDYLFFKSELEKELEQSQNLFVFHHYTYPPLKIYASTAFSYIEYDSYEDKVEDSKCWECCFLNIIPRDKQTEILIGYHKDYTNNRLINLTERLGNLDCEQLGTELTNIFVFHADDWGMSPSLYDKITINQKDLFCKLYTLSLMRHEASLWTDFNFFKVEL